MVCVSCCVVYLVWTEFLLCAVSGSEQLHRGLAHSDDRSDVGTDHRRTDCLCRTPASRQLLFLRHSRTSPLPPPAHAPSTPRQLELGQRLRTVSQLGLWPSNLMRSETQSVRRYTPDWHYLWSLPDWPLTRPDSTDPAESLTRDRGDRPSSSWGVAVEVIDTCIESLL